MRKKWLALPLVAALAILTVVALLVWFGVEDGRQAALLDTRVRQAEDRATQARYRFVRLRQDKKATGEEVRQAALELEVAEGELAPLRREQRRREASWPARLRREVRRRIGW